MMLKKIGLAALLILLSAQADAARIDFIGGSGNYRVAGYLEYDPDRMGTVSRGCYEPVALAMACFIMRQAKATT